MRLRQKIMGFLMLALIPHLPGTEAAAISQEEVMEILEARAITPVAVRDILEERAPNLLKTGPSPNPKNDAGETQHLIEHVTQCMNIVLGENHHANDDLRTSAMALKGFVVTLAELPEEERLDVWNLVGQIDNRLRISGVQQLPMFAEIAGVHPEERENVAYWFRFLLEGTCVETHRGRMIRWIARQALGERAEVCTLAGQLIRMVAHNQRVTQYTAPGEDIMKLLKDIQGIPTESERTQICAWLKTFCADAEHIVPLSLTIKTLLAIPSEERAECVGLLRPILEHSPKDELLFNLLLRVQEMPKGERGRICGALGASLARVVNPLEKPKQREVLTLFDCFRDMDALGNVEALESCQSINEMLELRARHHPSVFNVRDLDQRPIPLGRAVLKVLKGQLGVQPMDLNTALEEMSDLFEQENGGDQPDGGVDDVLSARIDHGGPLGAETEAYKTLDELLTYVWPYIKSLPKRTQEHWAAAVEAQVGGKCAGLECSRSKRAKSMKACSSLGLTQTWRGWIQT